MFNSLRIRLTLIFVALTVIPLLIVSVLIASRGFNTLQNQSVELQGEVAKRTSISLEAFFDARQAELFALTHIYGLDTLEPKAQRDILSTLLSEQTAYYQLVMVGSDGQETTRITRGDVITDKDLINRSDDSLYQKTVETGEINFGQVYFNEFARDRLITIAVPMEDLFTGKIANVLIAEVRFQNVSDAVLRDLNLTEGEDVYIVDSNGVILAHRDPNLVIKETTFALPEDEGRNIGLSNPDVILATDTIHLANQQLLVVAETTYSNATALATDLTNLSAIIALVTLVVSGTFVAWSVTRVVNPIINVARVATRVQQGDLTARADASGNDEIATLGRTFNKMTAELQNTLEGLQHNVNQLEASNEENDKLIKELKVAKRMADENSRLKSEFLATMSHELRTPMNAIEGFTGIILKRMAGTDYNEKSEHYLKKVQSNSQRLLGLINDFLDLSRIESGRLELAHMPMSPSEMAYRWRDNLSVLADNKGLAFNVVIDPNLPSTIYGDEESISKIAINLVGNAIKFTETGSVKLSLEKRDDKIALEVTDTGIGIPAHAKEFIFDEFRQVDMSSRRKYGGTGLGLAIVQKLAREMGGTVILQSDVGVGSTFTVLLPIHTEMQVA